MRVRASTRHRQESSYSVEIPVEELSSWSGDDVCANCGAPARSNHLYCSEQCKEEDAKHTSADVAPKASTSAPVLSSYKNTSKKVQNAPSWTEADFKFRYPCPPSPNILAKYNSVLTSPALVALERSLPTTSTPVIKNDKDSQSVSSSGGSSVAHQSKTKRRSSSRSTFSSASDVVSTEQGTPSSISEAIQDDDTDDLDALSNASDFHLPPSIQPFKSTPRETRSATATPSPGMTPDGSNRSPIGKVTPTPHHNARQNKKTIEFARKPYNTNLPPPVLFTSPVLAVTTMQRNDRIDGSVDTPRRKSSSNIQRSPKPDQATLKIKSSPSHRAERSLQLSTSFSGPAIVQSTTDSEALAMSTKPSSRGHHSPPCLPSASSSAGKTLRAMSPLENMSPGLYTTICGRFGCSGMGSSADSLKEIDANFSLHASQSPQRPSISRGHKHTHSAAAILSLSTSKKSSTLAAASKLMMTPSTQLVETEEFGLESKLHFSDGEKVANMLKSPPRGRSKARGRRSASHRSPSPPRGVSRRGHSEDITKQQHAVGSLSPSSARSQPIPRSQRRTSSVAKRQEVIDEPAEEQRRGRSPTERRTIDQKTQYNRQREETASTVTPFSHSCEMAWPAYGHDWEAWQEESKAVSGKLVGPTINGSKGYDDVDLDEL